ncbi:LppU/SCO3897 family protein [Dactylosporangium sp. CA-152071]|uniref:LppU/SCO3897 family protein n=1 Tax=Dactylosporangium sp. CA-152071 TaxID=3239933 RepID=UPI003D8F6FDE
MSKVVRFGVSIVVLVVLAGIGWYLNRDSAEKANVGDCMHKVAANELKIVKCGGADADFSVVGKVGDKKESDAMSDEKNVCEAFSEATTLYWWGESGKNGDVLCLKDLKAA